MVAELIGIIGGIIIVFAWILETIESVRRHKKLVDLRFSFMFLTAAILLAYYSWEKVEMVFFWLNIILIAILSVEMGFSIHLKAYKN